MSRKRKLTKGILDNGILVAIPDGKFEAAVCPLRKAFVEEVDERIKRNLAIEYGISFSQPRHASNNAKLGDVWTTKF